MSRPQRQMGVFALAKFKRITAVAVIVSILLSFTSELNAAVPGLPFTEDFAVTALQDPALTSGNWNTEEKALLLATFKRRYRPFGLYSIVNVGSVDSTTSLALADIDGDGDVDIMEGNGGVNLLYLNDNGFMVGIPVGSAQSTNFLALADLDGDGDIDVMEGNSGAANRLFLNNGTADPFGGVSPILVGSAQQTTSLALADMDGDGDIDLMVGSTGTNLLFLNNGTTDPFNGISGIVVGSGQTTLTLVLADMDGDGDVDMMEGNDLQANRLFLNNGTANPFNGVTPISVGTAEFTKTLALADLDGDGDIDLVEGIFIKASRLFLNNGTADPFNGVTPIEVGISQNTLTYSLALADIDGDGDIDIIEGNLNQANRLLLNNGTADPFSGVTPKDLGTAQNTVVLALADLDGDGNVDLMEGNQGQLNRLFRNSAGFDPFSGGFGVAFGIEVGSASRTEELALADIDGDGDIDVMEGSSLQANRLFLNNGTADPFNGVIPIEVGSAQLTLSLALADMDGDGDIDVMEGNNDQANRLFLNNGTNNPFSGVTPIAVGSAQSTQSLVLADIDGDGDIDVMEGNASQANRLFLNNGTADPFNGVVPIEVGSAQGTLSLALADIDGDGDIDVMEGNYEQANRLFLNNGTNNPFSGVAPIAVGSAQTTQSLALADIDGDGDIDLMEGSNNHPSRLFLNNGGTNPFNGVTPVAVGSLLSTYSLALADIDGDGRIDVILGRLVATNQMFLNNGTANPFNSVNPIEVGAIERNTFSLALADIDGDGHLDVMEGNYEQANRLFLHIGTGNPFNAVTSIEVGITQDTFSLALADVDGDGDIDMMEGIFNKANYLYLNNGKPNSFKGVTPIAVGTARNTHSLALADIDGDGDIDVMEGNDGQTNRLFLNNGGANPFNGVIPFDVGSAQNTRSVALADIDGDGDIDVIEGNYDQANRLFMNNGGANPFNGVAAILVGSAQNTLSIALADIDGDGDIDVMEGNDGQANRLFLNNGTGNPFSGVTPIAVGSAQATQSLALADIDGDGDIDLMEGNDGQANRLFLNNGGANPFNGVTPIAVGSGQMTRSIALADIDSDGDIDLMEGNMNQVNRLFLNNNGVDPFGGVTPITVGSALGTSALALVDIDGNGQIEVMEGNAGQINRLFMRRWFDTSRNRGGSLAVDNTAENIPRVQLSADVELGDLSSNTGVSFYLSNNGGLQWFLVKAGKPFSFPTTGSDLRWRVALRSLSPHLSPRVNSLTITSDLSSFDVLFRDGFESPKP